MPNSLTELNGYSNTSVVYNDDRDYAITFSANAAANTSSTIDEDQSFVVPTGIDITSVISQPGNITYNVIAGTVGNVVGTWPTLPYGISNTSLGNVFSITGTFDAVTWTTAKALTLTFPDKETNFSFSANLVYPNTANVSTNNVWSWTNNVTVANTNPNLSLTTSYNFAEDVPTTFVYSILDLDPTATYTLTFDQFSGTDGLFTLNGNSFGIGNIATVSGNRATVNAANVTFYPYPDTASNVQVYVNAIKSNPFGNVTFASNVVANLTCVSSHDEYTITTNYAYNEDSTSDLVFDITDTDPTATSYTVTFAQSTGNTGVFFVNDTAQGIGNAVILSNSKANINAANISFLPAADDTGNIGLLYSQVKTKPYYGNVAQATNVALSLTCISTHNDYNFQTTGTYDEDTLKSFSSLIADTDARATSYIISLQQTSGNIGRWYLNGNLFGNANSVLTLSNSKANINAANIQYLPAIDNTGNIQITYNQSKVNSIFGNITQAANLSGTYSIGNINTGVGNLIGVTRTYDSNTSSTIFSNTVPYINDGSDVGQNYTITLTSSLGRFGNSFANMANTYTFTGNISQVNSQFSILRFAPFPAQSGNGTFTYTQTRDGISQINTTVTLNGVAVPYSPQTYTLTSSGSFTPNAEKVYYSSTQNLLLVGGGGGGASPYGSGGGGGRVVVANVSTGNTYAIQSKTYTVTIGGGGGSFYGTGSNTQANTGGTTSITDGSITWSAVGGTGGWANVIPYRADGGNSGVTVATSPSSGTFTAYTGGNGRSSLNFNEFKGGGGGAGAGTNGGNANITLPGNGGDGYLWSFDSNYYGGGGGGAGFDGDASPATNLFGTGGQGGGGSGGGGNALADGDQNTGGGGSGGMTNRSGGQGPGNGGSGIIIIKLN